MKTNLEILAEAYMKAVELWTNGSNSYNCYMVAKAISFLQGEIKKELSK